MTSQIGVICLIVTLVGLSESCSPPGPPWVAHPQNYSCSAKYLMVGKVLSSNLVPGLTRRYRVRVLAPIKGFKLSDVGKVKSIYTPSSGAACGITFTVGKVYAFGANPNGSRLFIRAFMFKYEYSTMTIQQHMYMWFKSGRYSYRGNCKCTVSKAASALTCVPKTTNQSCYANVAVCRYNWLKKKCGWVNAESC